MMQSGNGSAPHMDAGDLVWADHALISALATGDTRAAAALLDDEFTWVNLNGRILDKGQALSTMPKPPLGTEVGLAPVGYHYGEVATIAVDRDKVFVLRIWVKRAAGWRLLVYHAVSQNGPAAPHVAGRKEWDNPCKMIPYEPRNADERDCLASWQQLEIAVMQHEPEVWAQHVVDEFMVVGAARRHSKADRKAVLEEQQRTGANSAPASLVSARLFGFKAAIVMTCEHQPFHGKAARVSRVFVKRDSRWLMAVSFQTTRQDAPVKTIYDGKIMNRRNTPRVSFIGFGEAGQAIAAGLRESGIERIAAWDILFPEPGGARLKAAGASIGVRLANSAADAVVESDMIISAVTASSSLEAARSVERHLTAKPYYLDINSVSPGRKQETAKLLGERARYVDVAVIAPINPARHRTPLLIAGPHAEAISPLLRELQMQLSIVGDNIGQAAAIKMIRSVMIKGIEALTVECFLAAARAGVLDEVTVSLKNNYPTLDFTKIAEYNLERMASHGERRAAEMEESAATLRELGLDPMMVDATVKRQREMGEIGKHETVRATLKDGRSAILNAISTAAKNRH